MSRLNTKLEQLLADALLGIATAEQRAELNTRLATDDALLDEYLRLSRTDAALHFQHGHVTAPIAELGSRNAVVKTSAAPSLPRSPFRVLPWSIAIAAAALLSAAIVVVYLIAFTTDPQPDPIKPSQPGPRLATLIENTGDLTTPHGYPAEGEDFSAGEYTLSSGTAEFMLTNAVNVKLRGDTRMHMRNDMNVALTHGTAEFVVPRNANGFTVHLPNDTRVIDRGTRFQLAIDDAGQTAIRVLEGEVHIERNDAEPIALVAGQVARVAHDPTAPIEVAELSEVLHLSLGETTRGTGQVTHDETVWNTLAELDTAIGNLRFADGSVADGVTATQRGKGANPNDVEGVGYVDTLDDMTKSLVYSTEELSAALTVSGLTPGSVWDVEVYAAITDSVFGPRTQDIAVNGIKREGLGFTAVYNSGAPVLFTGVIVDERGDILVTASGGKVDPTAGPQKLLGIEILQAVTIRSKQTLNPRAASPSPPAHHE